MNSSEPSQTQQILYGLPPSDFHDITTGNNGHAAGSGYDMVTGIGTPVANLLVPQMCSLTVSVGLPWNQSDAAATSASATIVVTFSDQVTGLTQSSFNLAQTGTGNASIQSFNLVPGTLGTYDVFVTGTVNRTNFDSATLTVPEGAVQDGYGNLNLASTGVNNTVTFVSTLYFASGSTLWNTTAADWNAGDPGGPLVQWADAVTTVFPGNQTGSQIVTIAATNFDPQPAQLQFTSGTTTPDIRGGEITLPASGTTVLVAAGTTAEIDSTIVSGALTMDVSGSGSGTLILNASNTYNGGTIVNSNCVVRIENGSALGSGNVTVDNQATLQLQGAITVATSAYLYLASVNNGTGMTTLESVSGDNYWSGPIEVTNSNGAQIECDNSSDTLELTRGIGDFGNSGTSFPLTFAGSGSVIVGGTQQNYEGIGQYVSDVTMNGPGTLILNAADSYSGATNVIGGRLDAGGGGPNLTVGSIYVASATLDLGGANVTTSQTVTVVNGTICDGTLTSTNSNYNVQGGTISAALAGTGNVGLTSSGAVSLSGANTYNGGTVVQNGTLTIWNNSALGSGAVTVDAGATLDNEAPNATAGALALYNNANVQSSDNGILNVSSLGVYGPSTIVSGTVTMTSTSGLHPIGANLTIGANATFNAASTVSVPASTTITVYGWAYLGNTLSRGTISVAQGGTLTVRSGATLTEYVGSALTITGTLNNGGTLADNGGTITGNIVDNALMRFLGDSDMSYGGVISGTGGVEKDDNSNLTLSGANTFIGSITVNGGTLTVGSDSALGLAATATVTINNGSLLNVNNHVVVVNAVTLNSGVIDLGTGALIVPLTNFSFIPASSTQPNERGVVGVVETGINAVHDALQEGSNLATGYWDGTNGILSSTAANDSNGYTTVGFVDNSLTEYSSWRGKSVGTSQVLISYTYYGDANLDGYVDGPNDYSLWLATVASGTPSISTLTGKAVEWIDGDFNGDGIVDGPNDYSLWAETVGMTALGFNAS